MFRVPSTSGVPTARRSSEGPSALMTPLAPRTAASTAALSRSSLARTVSFGSLNVSLLGDRTNAVTSSPRFSACSTTCRPMRPEAPKTTIRRGAPMLDKRVSATMIDSLSHSMIDSAIVSGMATTSTDPASQRAGGVIDERATSEGLLLALLGQQAMRRLRAAHTEHNVSPRQFHLLGLLHDLGPTTQRELGTLMDVDPSVLVGLLNPLEADGYLARERDSADRRRHVVTLTQAGERQLELAAQAQRDAEDELFAGLTRTQREQLRGLLLILRERLVPE